MIPGAGTRIARARRQSASSGWRLSFACAALDAKRRPGAVNLTIAPRNVGGLPRSVGQAHLIILAAGPGERKQVIGGDQTRMINEQKLVRADPATDLLQGVDHRRDALAAGGDGEYAEIADAEVLAEGIRFATPDVVGHELARIRRRVEIGAIDWHSGVVGFEEKVFALALVREIETERSVGNDGTIDGAAVDCDLSREFEGIDEPPRGLWG